MKYFPSFSCKNIVGFGLHLMALFIIGCTPADKETKHTYTPDPLAKNWSVDSAVKQLDLPDSLLQKAETQISDMYFHFYPGGRGVFGIPSVEMEKNVTWSYTGDSLLVNYEITEGDSATGLYIIKELKTNSLILSEDVGGLGKVTYYMSSR